MCGGDWVMAELRSVHIGRWVLELRAVRMCMVSMTTS